MKLSVVATLYCSAPHLEEFCKRITDVAHYIAGNSFEIILVNDGSPDNSLDLALQLSNKNPHITIVDLSRNFGHHRAMMTGLTYASGELVYLIDSDLEEEPEWLINFSEQMHQEQCDVVYGVQIKRRGNWFERISGQVFYRLFRVFTGLDLPENIVVARLMTKRYVKALLLHKEREIYIAGLWHITGFKQTSYSVTKHATSKTTYTFQRKISLLINSITAFSNLPLIAIFYFGVVISMFSGGYSLFLIANRLFFHTPLSGWTSLMMSIWLLGGLIVSFIGIVGIYLSKIFSETKQRPYSIIRQVYKNTDSHRLDVDLKRSIFEKNALSQDTENPV
jgi:putative glycosyltransferase